VTFTSAEKAAIAAAEPEWIQVGERKFEPHHRKADNTTNVMTKFRCGNVVHKAWYCPGREGVGREKACEFWSDHAGLAPFPKDADEWLARTGELRPTAEISVRPDGKYISIVGARPAGSTVAL
jgi:DNA repair protein RadD